MKSRMTIALLVTAVMLGVFQLTQLMSWAQESADGVTFDENRVAIEEIDIANQAVETARKYAMKAHEAELAARRKIEERAADGFEKHLQLHFRRDSGDEIRGAAAAVNEAEEGEARAAAEGKLNALLEQYFDEDMKRREDELVKIEERLAKLRELLDLRRARKQEIIDLQSKVALNEAAGLGFYGNDSPPGFFKEFRFEGMPQGAGGMPQGAGNVLFHAPGQPRAAEPVRAAFPAPAAVPVPPSAGIPAPAAAPAPPSAGNELYLESIDRQ